MQAPSARLVAPVRPEWRDRLPAVVHRDGSCRIHTVTEASNPTFYALLKAFRRRTGISVLLNTSFNRRGMPIVETPGDAIEFFRACALDALVLEDRLVTRKEERTLPASRPRRSRRARARSTTHRPSAGGSGC